MPGLYLALTAHQHEEVDHLGRALSLFSLAESSRRSHQSPTLTGSALPYLQIQCAFEDLLLDRGSAFVTRDNMAVGRLQDWNPLLPS